MKRAATLASASHGTICRIFIGRSGTPIAARNSSSARASFMPCETFRSYGSVARDVRADGIDREKAFLSCAVETEKPAQRAVVHVEDARVALLQERRAVRLEVDRDAVRQDAVAVHLDAEALAHAAAVAVRRNHVIRAHLALRAAIEIAEHGTHAGGVLLERRELRAIAQLRTELLRALAQHRLEHVLVDEEPPCRAAVADPNVEIRDEPRELFARERLDGDDAALRVVGLERLAAHFRLEADLAHDLDGPDLEVARARMDRGSRMALDRERAHAVPREQ